MASDPVSDLRSKLLKGGSIALVTKVGAAALSYLMFVAVARLMNEPEFGRFAFGFSLAIFLSVLAGLGLQTAILRFWPQYETQGQLGLAKGILIWGGVSTLVSGIAAGVLVACGAVILSKLRLGENYAYLLATATLILPLAISEYLSSALRIHGYLIRALVPRDILWRIGVPTVSAIVVVVGFDLKGALALVIAAATLTAISLAQGYFVWRAYRDITANVPAELDTQTWRQTTKPIWGAAILNAVIQHGDVLVVGLLMSAIDAGIYFAALRTASLLGLMLMAANMIGAPMISKYRHSGDTAGLQRLCRLLATGISLPTILGFVLIILIGGPLLRAFDPTYETAYPILIVLGFRFVFNALSGPTGYLLQMSGFETTYLRILLISYLITFTMQMLLIPVFGLYGAAIPSCIAVIIWNLWARSISLSKLNVDPTVLSILKVNRLE